MTKPDSGSVKSITEIAGKIQYLEGIKEEYLRTKAFKQARILKRALKELYWVLGVDQK